MAFRDGKFCHWELILSFKGTLGLGEVVRVHSGSGPESLLHAEDRNGATYNIFTGRKLYVWNNGEGDTSRITENTAAGEVDVDRASYAPYPPEGVILVRVGAKLVPSSAS